jgi:hypothetical protein
MFAVAAERRSAREFAFDAVALFALVSVETAALLALLAGPPRWTNVRPLGLALAAGLMISVGHISLPHEVRREVSRAYAELAHWPFNIILAAGLLWLVRLAAREAGRPDARKRDWLANDHMRVIVAAIVLLAVVGSPGILAGLLLLVLARATRDILPLAFGMILLAVSLVLFWCDLKVNLTARAGLLAASGLVLLGARSALWRLDACATPVGKEAA